MKTGHLGHLEHEMPTPHRNNYLDLVAPEEFSEEAPAKQESDLLTVGEVADLLRVDDTTVRRWCKQGVLTHVTLPHVGKRETNRIPRAAIMGAIERGSFTEPGAEG